MRPASSQRMWPGSATGSAETMSSRGLLRSMAIIGSAQAVKIAITIIRAKTVAVLLGPSGTGLLSVFNNLRELSSQGAGLGLGSSGVRELSAAKGDTATLSRVRRVLLGALVIQGPSRWS